MPPPEARIHDITARLAAVGLEPERKEYSDHTAIEAHVPGTFPVESWPDVLALLETADWFGLADSVTRGRTLWVAVRRDASAVSDAAEEPDHQP